MFEDMLYESTPRKFLAPAVNSVILMPQRPNIAVLIVRVKFRRFYQIKLSVDRCWEMKMWLDQRLIQICGRLGFWQYTLKLASSYSYI